MTNRSSWQARTPSHFRGQGGAELQYTDAQWTEWRRAAIACELCGKVFTDSKSKHGDHNHETGKWRGVLCLGCNVLIGYLEKLNKNPLLTAKAQKYLQERGK